MSKPKSQILLERIQKGDDDAAAAVFDQYVERLVAFTRSRIGAKLKRRIDPEDVVQSAYRSFFVHAQNEEYALTRSGDLWRLLAKITLLKLYGQIQKQTAERRSVERETRTAEWCLEASAPDPTPAEAAALAEQLHLVIQDLSREQQVVLTARLEGRDFDEISKLLGKSERTARRLLADVRQRLEQRLLSHSVAAKETGEKPSLPTPEPYATLSYDDYDLRKLVGSGGMGKVYRAREKSSGTTVAVKALHKALLTDRRSLAQFFQESQILAQLRHPNVIAVKGLGRFPYGGLFIVMDYVDGADLQTQLNRRRFSLSVAVSVVKQAALAAAYVHRHGVVHCDLKPANILLTRDDRVVVTDFGFAFRIAGESKTAAGDIGGTEGYIAPEVFKRLQPPTPAADIFALGAVLQTLVGNDGGAVGPVDGRSSAAFDRIAAICETCLASEPADRFQSAEQLHRALRDVLPDHDG